MNKKLMRATAFATALAITASAMSLSVYAAPAKYSAVEQGYVTPVKNQASWGVCWAFASTAISESSLLKKFPEKYNSDTLDLSENLMAYMVSHPSLYGHIGMSGDVGKYTQSSTYYLDAGGSAKAAGFFMMNGYGPYAESVDYPFSEHGTPSIAEKEFTESEYYALRDSGVAKMNGMFLADLNMNSDNDELKELIMQYGAASISYCETYEDGKFGDDGGFYQYCPTQKSTNHAVTVVGWDDSIPASSFKSTPEGDGAWLIKNSWGDTRDNGYFWLSYYDKTLSTQGVAFGMTVSGADDYYDTVYSYDGGNALGWFSMSGYADIYGANVFTADADAKINGAAFYANKGVTVEATVYTGLTDATSPASGTKAASKTVTVQYEGYNSVYFDTPAKIAKGDKFAVVIKVSDSSYKPRLYIEAAQQNLNGITYTLETNAGESFYSLILTIIGRTAQAVLILKIIL